VQTPQPVVLHERRTDVQMSTQATHATTDPATPPAGLGRVATAMATPFTDEGTLDLDGAQKLASHLLDSGTEMLVVCGTTGESPTLQGDEPWQLLEAVLEVARGRATVMMGTGSNDTARTVTTTRRAAEAGADAALVVTPYYNRPDQRGLLRHFGAVADATELPLVLYDIRSRTGTAIDVATQVELAQRPTIVGVKDASGDLGKACDVLAATTGAPGGYALWSGADELNLPLLAVGGVGVVSVAAHLVGPEIARMIAAYPSDPAEARSLHLACMPLHRALFAAPSPAPLKGTLRALGLPAGPVRPPLADATQDVVDAAVAAYQRIAGTR
jgi:4-hydroxy-tetrahydrodipicolinate synthase